MSTSQIVMLHFAQAVHGMVITDLTPWEQNVVQQLVSEELVTVNDHGVIKEILE